MEYIQSIVQLILQVFSFLAGPHGGYLLSVFFNVASGMIILVLLRQIFKLTEDIKLLVLKYQLPPEEFKEYFDKYLKESKFKILSKDRKGKGDSDESSNKN